MRPHRFNKAQQDALLPAVEEGLITLIGATTEILTSRSRALAQNYLGEASFVLKDISLDPRAPDSLFERRHERGGA